jgi:copper chaperone CopZ
MPDVAKKKPVVNHNRFKITDMKNLIVISLISFCFTAKAQITKVSLQASGLTCSMCSNAINKAIQSLDFVEKVDANIKNSTFEILFKPNSNIDFDKIKKKVEGAGFFVANFTATMHFDNIAVANDTHLDLGATTFHFLNVKTETLSGDKTIRLLDKGFVPAKEFKKNSSLTKMPCYKTGEENGKRIFHVTI